MVVVTEADIIKDIKYTGFGITEHYERAIEYIMNSHTDTVDFFKAHYPQKAKKGKLGWPHILWIAPSIHDNYEPTEHYNRKKFTTCLEKITKTRAIKKINSLRLKIKWDKNDPKIYENNKFSPHGWNTYWLSVDHAIQYFVEKIIPNLEAEINENKYKMVKKSDNNLPSLSAYNDRELKRSHNQDGRSGYHPDKRRVEFTQKERNSDRDRRGIDRAYERRRERERKEDQDFYKGFRKLPTPPKRL